MASYSLWIRHNYDIRRFVVFDGYPVAEFEKLLQAAFGETAAVAGCLVRGGAQASLSSLCSNPSFKGIYDLAVRASVAPTEGRGGSERSNVVNPPSGQQPGQRNLQSLFHLTWDDAEELLDVFREACAPEWCVDRPTFTACLRKFLRRSGASAQDDPSQLLERLFTSFNKSSGPNLGLKDLLNGLFVLSGGEGRTDAAVRDMFEMWDADDTGVVSPANAKTFLTRLYSALDEKAPQAFHNNDLRPSDLAGLTAQRCFREGDLDRSNTLTYEEFRRWYLHPQQAQLRNMVAEHSPPAETRRRESTQRSAHLPIPAADGQPEWLNLAEIARVTGLGQLAVADVVALFTAMADDDASLTPAAFAGIIDRIVGAQSATDAERRRIVIDRLVSIFDPDNAGYLNAIETAACLCTLSGSSRAHKARQVFDLFDDDDDGWISVDELRSFLSSVFRMAFTIEPAEANKLDGTFEECVNATVIGCFQYNGLPASTSRLNKTQFVSWYSSAVQSADEADTRTASMSLHDFAVLTGLAARNPSEVLAVLSDAADEENELLRAEFVTAFRDRVLTAAQRSDPHVTDLLFELFDIFDTDRDGIVDCFELAAGVAQLCTGEHEDKAEAAFALLDENSDGQVSMQEMIKYLTSVFTVLFKVQPDACPPPSSGLTPTSLAVLLTDKCFDAADANGDHVLSLSEFKDWTSASITSGVNMAATARRLATGHASTDPAPRQADLQKAAAAQMTRVVVAPPPMVTLDEVKRITGLGAQAPIDVLCKLEDSSDDVGSLTRDAFVSAFVDHFIPPLSSAEYERARLLLDRTFDIFDTDGDGVVDCIELSAGLVSLCGGTSEDKVAAAFALYDEDNDGTIRMGEMVAFLNATFQVLFKVEQASGASFDTTPAEFAERTADAAFQEMGVAKDGVVTLDKLRHWFASSPRGGLVDMVVAIAEHPPQEVVFERLRKAAGLGTVSASDALAAFEEAADEELNLTREAFHEVLRSKFLPKSQSNLEYEQSRLLLNRVFDAFDTDGNGIVDFKELAAGVAALCGGSPVNQVEAAFALYDADSDGYIAKPEMEQMLTAVYRVMFQARPSYAAAIGSTAAELAALSTRHCFAEADTNEDGKLSLEEFTAWYTSKGGDALKASVVKNVAAMPAAVSIAQVKDITGLAKVPVTDVWPVFQEAANEDGSLSRDEFAEVFRSQFLPHQSAQEYERSMLLINRVFDAFDVDHDGTVDCIELATGLTLLCGESEDDRVEAAFALYDQDNDGYISRAEMQRFLHSVYKVIFRLEEGMAEVDTLDVARSTTARCFKQAGATGDTDCIDFEQFQAWVTSDGSRGLKEGVIKAAVMAPLETTMADLARLTGINRMPVDAVLEELTDGGDSEGNIDLAAFLGVFRDRFLPHLSSIQYNRARLLVTRLFKLFDTNDDGVVDCVEMATGLVGLCAASRDKVMDAFSLYDRDNDGCITQDEMEKLFTSVLRVSVGLRADPATVGALSSVVERSFDGGDGESKGVVADGDSGSGGDSGDAEPTVEEEAMSKVAAEFYLEATARDMVLRCFKEAGAEDGKMTLDQLRAWYTEHGDDPLAVRLVDMPADLPANLVVEEVLALSDLRNHHVEDVLPKFREAADEGRIKLDAFMGVFRTHFLKPHMSNLEDQRAEVLIRRLFSTFDTAESGSVNMGELLTGLTLLCGGSRVDKAAATFAFYDRNGDGTISFDEMQRYLLSVFRMLFVLEPHKHAHGVTPESLAEDTTRQCFKAADTDGNGAISLPEFLHWFTTPGGEMTKATTALVLSASISIAELHDISTLGDVPVAEVSRAFRRAGDVDGTVSRAAFHAIMQHFLGEQSDAVRSRTRDLCNRVFDALDANHDGTVDASEMETGVTLLCGGSPAERIRAAFEAHSQDGEVLDVDGATAYLESVYRVLFTINPKLAQRVGTSPESLAVDATRKMFLAADLNDDGTISYDEFVRWYSSTPHSTAETLEAGYSHLGNMHSLKTTFDVDVVRLAEELIEVAHPNHGLPRAAYFGVLRKVLGRAAEDAHNKVVLDQVFTAVMDTTSRCAPLDAIVSSVSVLCADADQHAAAMFAVYDTNQDGYISRDEMARHLTYVFGVACLPSVRTRHALPPLATPANETHTSPAAMADRVARAAFNTCDLDDDGRLSFDEFSAWLDRVGFSPHAAASPRRRTKLTTVHEDDSTDEDDDEGDDGSGDSDAQTDSTDTSTDLPETGMEGFTLEELQDLTNLKTQRIGDVLASVRKHARDGTLSRTGFYAAFNDFRASDSQDSEAVALTLRALFDAFDLNGDGVVSENELVCGLSILCGGPKQEKVRAIFDLYDANHDGTIDRKEMQEYLSGVYTTVFFADPTLREQAGCSAEELAAATTAACFEECDHNEDGKLSFEEFQDWTNVN